jgi:hypothetical protein
MKATEKGLDNLKILVPLALKEFLVAPAAIIAREKALKAGVKLIVSAAFGTHCALAVLPFAIVRQRASPYAGRGSAYAAGGVVAEIGDDFPGLLALVNQADSID